jgi:hypothetical protein
VRTSGPRGIEDDPGAAILRAAVPLALALLAFAGNSLLCRAALGPGLIDPATFTAVRLGAGAVALGAIAAASGRARFWRAGSWGSAAALAAYAVAFSAAYLWIDAGVGALVLFAAVQLTMLVRAAMLGERLGVRGYGGVLLALGGLAALTLGRPGRAEVLGLARIGHTRHGAA